MENNILAENVYIETKDGKMVPTTVIVVAVTGGKQVRYIDKDGNILKRVQYSDSKYYRDARKKQNTK